MEFIDLGINKRILDAIKEEGYTEPSPIQKEAIPVVLTGRDVLGCAQTGSGKTAAFAIPILQQLALENNNPRKIKALVLAPTRELALQIHESFKTYGKYLKSKCGVIMGGVSQGFQVKMINSGVDILVATPGRLLDLINQKIVFLDSLRYLVLDEADQMLDMGFINDIKKILRFIPIHRQTLFFTATMPDEILKLTNDILKDPYNISVNPVSSTVDTIKQYVYFTDKTKKNDLLKYCILKNGKNNSTLIFTRTKHQANKVAQYLSTNGIKAMAIHGNKSQSARQQALNSFKEGNINALVATDIAARGIDISDLSCVINFDLPEVNETYVHRIGRTGRAGKSGVSISFCDINEVNLLKSIEKLIKREIEVIEDHPYKMEVKVKKETKKSEPKKNNKMNVKNKKDDSSKSKLESPKKKTLEVSNNKEKNFKKVYNKNKSKKNIQ